MDCRLKLHEFSPTSVLLDLMWNLFIIGPLTLLLVKIDFLVLICEIQYSFYEYHEHGQSHKF